MEQVSVEFNQSPVVRFPTVPLDEQLIVNTAGLFNASVDAAYKYGSDAIRQVLTNMEPLWQHDRKYVTVDAKVHMLFPKMSPAIPGWHTDGIPRLYDDGKHSVHKGVPDWNKQASGDWRKHRYWLYNSSNGGCPTYFDLHSRRLTVKNGDTSVYADINEQVGDDNNELPTRNDGIYQFDWYNLHRVKPATRREWRLLVRVVESDYFEPQDDPATIIRNQQQVYIQKGFGW